MNYSIKEVAEVLAKKEQAMRAFAVAIAGGYTKAYDINIEAANNMLDGIIQYLQDIRKGE